MRPAKIRLGQFRPRPLQLWEWALATVLIENDWGDPCTGFLVGQKVDDLDGWRILLVSNKHALPTEPGPRAAAAEITVNLNMRGPDNTTVGVGFVLPLCFEDGSPIFREHTDSVVDVMAFGVTSLIAAKRGLQWRFATHVDLADRSKLEQWDVRITEDVLVIGYPLGLTQGTSNLPVVRSGIIATRIGEPFVENVENGRTIRGFLVDGATIHGSSGSPAILKPAVGRVVKGTVLANRPTPALLLGIIAETYYAPVDRYRKAFAGLGLAFDAETIKETIDMFLE